MELQIGLELHFATNGRDGTRRLDRRQRPVGQIRAAVWNDVDDPQIWQVPLGRAASEKLPAFERFGIGPAVPLAIGQDDNVALQFAAGL